jgi:hypothetical protein
MKERGNIVKISEIAEAVDGRVVCGESYPAGWQEREIEFGFSSDLMSDVLTISAEPVLLITGLAAIQTIRTAAIADIACVLLVRNKHATGDMKSLAAEYGMVLIESGISMFRASALLHDRGLKPVY